MLISPARLHPTSLLPPASVIGGIKAVPRLLANTRVAVTRDPRLNDAFALPEMWFLHTDQLKSCLISGYSSAAGMRSHHPTGATPLVPIVRASLASRTCAASATETPHAGKRMASDQT